MENYRLTKKADTDLSNLYEYGISNFGLLQAQSYLIDLYDRFQLLSDNPLFGRSAVQFEPKLRRFEYKAHVIFYMLEDNGVLIVRVLGDEMDFKRHF